MRLGYYSNMETIAQDCRTTGGTECGCCAAVATGPVGGEKVPNAGLRGFLEFAIDDPLARAALLGLPMALPGLVLLELLGRPAEWARVLALAGAVVAGRHVARAAASSLLSRRTVDVRVLMTAAALGAVAIGAWVEAAMVMVLYGLGEALEGYTAARARGALQSLALSAPSTAELLDAEGRASTVPAADVAPGDTILVRPGASVPLDGRVVRGVSSVDGSAITGEARPVEAQPGTELWAGSINGSGVLEVRVVRAADDSAIQRIARMVDEARARPSESERTVDRFARYYTPAVVALAVAVAIVPPLLLGQPFVDPPDGGRGWLYRGLALLVVACPCALVISTPVAVAAALARSARDGVLIKGGAVLEALARVRPIAFDKTGTLTAGRPAVVSVRSGGCLADAGSLELAGAAAEGRACPACDELVGLAGAVEARSEHVYARAVVGEADRRGLSEAYPSAADVRAVAGRGVRGSVNGRDVVIASHSYFDGHVPHGVDHCAAAGDAASEGATPLLVSVDGNYLGTITVSDVVRPEAREVTRQLRALGLGPLALLTGDARSPALRIAEDAGLDPAAVRSGLMPEDKLAAIAELRATAGAPVAMVGDGINDAPALAAADVGIAIGSGTAQALDTADIALMGDDLHQLPYAVRMARRALRTVHINILLSVGIKLAFVVLVLAGWGTLWMAVVADMGTSIAVTLNGMRLLGGREAGGSSTR